MQMLQESGDIYKGTVALSSFHLGVVVGAVVLFDFEDTHDIRLHGGGRSLTSKFTNSAVVMGSASKKRPKA